MSIVKIRPQIMVHFRCRNRKYPFSNIIRLTVPDNKVSWSVPWDDYKPPEYHSDILKNKSWADKKIGENFHPLWNKLDGKVNRKSYMGQYKIRQGYPLNPEGRTGLKGRGILGRWGPNHAADPIVTRWKIINGLKQYNPTTTLPILEVIAIQRRDNDRWAFPGGMVDPGEKIFVTLQREFMEEALNSLERKQKLEDRAMISRFFSSGKEIHSGYVDDSRNTDNAWIETLAVNFHDETGTTVGKFWLQAGDDAQNVKWFDVNRNLKLFGVHTEIIQKVAAMRKAHW